MVFQVTPKILVSDRDEGDNARIRVVCSTKEKGSDAEACNTFRVITDVVNIFYSQKLSLKIKQLTNRYLKVVTTN